MPRLAIGVDLGGTNLRCVAATPEGVILSERQTATGAEDGPDVVIRRIADAVMNVARESGADTKVAVGVAAPGPLDPRSGVVIFAPNLPGWHDIPLRERLADLTGREVLIGNDANSAALGELYFGAGQGLKHLIYIGLGTGVGGGVISDGRLVDGVRGMGGELGHVSVNFDGPRCHCGGSGCIEAYCSAWAITEAAQLLVASGRGQAILDASPDGAIGVPAVGAAAERGDPYAASLLERAGVALGVGLANFVNIFNPQVIAIGGGLAEIGEPLLGPARRALEAWSMPMIRQDMQLVRSKLGARTGIYGAVALVFHAREGR